jgi:hypothetical protein
MPENPHGTTICRQEVWRLASTLALRAGTLEIEHWRDLPSSAARRVGGMRYAYQAQLKAIQLNGPGSISNFDLKKFTGF